MVSRSSILAVVAWVTWEKLWAMHGSLEFRKVSTHVGQEAIVVPKLGPYQTIGLACQFCSDILPAVREDLILIFSDRNILDLAIVSSEALSYLRQVLSRDIPKAKFL